MKPVIIEWVDAFGDAIPWTDIKDLDKKRRVIMSCGYLLEKQIPKHHSLALSYDPTTEHVSGVIHIPKCNVVEIKYLKQKGIKKGPSGG